MSEVDFSATFRRWYYDQQSKCGTSPTPEEIARWAFDEGRRSGDEKLNHAYHQYRDRFLKDFEAEWGFQQGALFLKEENSDKEWRKSLADYFARWGLKWMKAYAQE